MIKKLTKIISVTLIAATVLSGCAKRTSVADYSTAVVATFGDTKIYLNEANFYARLLQYSNEQYFSSFSSDFWDKDYSGSGKTMEEDVKQYAMQIVYQTELLSSKAAEYGISLTDADTQKVSEAVTKFLNETDQALLDAIQHDEAFITNIYTQNALAVKVKEYLISDVDTNVDRETFKRMVINYVEVTDTSEDDTVSDSESQTETSSTSAIADTTTAADTTAESAAEPAVDLEVVANEILSRVKSGEDISTVAESYGYTSKNETIGKDTYDNALGTTSWTLTTGQTALAYDEATGYYVIQCVSDYDAEATDSAINTEIESRKDTMFQEKYEALENDGPKFKVDERVWSEITFDKHLYVAETTAAASGSAEITAETATDENGNIITSTVAGETAATDANGNITTSTVADASSSVAAQTTSATDASSSVAAQTTSATSASSSVTAQTTSATSASSSVTAQTTSATSASSSVTASTAASEMTVNSTVAQTSAAVTVTSAAQ